MTHSYVWHDSFICVSWLIHMCDMTRPYAWCDAFICNASFTCVADSFICVTNISWDVLCVSFICVTQCMLQQNAAGSSLVYMCDVWHDSFMYVTQCTLQQRLLVACMLLVRDSFMCAVTHSSAWHDSLRYVMCLIHMCDTMHVAAACCWFVTSLYVHDVWHDTSIYVTQCALQQRPLVACMLLVRDCFTWVLRLMHLCDMSRLFVCCHSFIFVTQCMLQQHAPGSWLVYICGMTHSWTWCDARCSSGY